MACQLSPGIHVAMVADHAIVLDECADRYTKLDATLSVVLKHCLDGSDNAATAASVAHLQALGVITPSDEVQTTSLSAPPVARASVAVEQGDSFRLLATAFHLASARRQLRVDGLAATLAQARRRAARCLHQDDDRAAAIARRFRASRGWLPFARACLPDSLALHAVMCRRSLRTTLVIGVRDYPFSAHCWLQSGSLVLTDPLDAIQPLVPILVL